MYVEYYNIINSWCMYMYKHKLNYGIDSTNDYSTALEGGRGGGGEERGGEGRDGAIVYFQL